MRISDWSSDVCSSDLIAAGPIAFYAPEAVPTGDAARVFRRAEALRAIFKDSEHFTARGWSRFSQLIGDSWDQVPVESYPPEPPPLRGPFNHRVSQQRMASLADKVLKYARDAINQFKEERKVGWKGKSGEVRGE